MSSIGATARRIGVSCWNRLSNASTRYAWGVLFLLGGGLAGEFLVSAHLEAGTASQTFVHGLSEAALVSGVLALLVDPYLKRRMQDDSGWAALFGYLNPQAPKELREALQDLATCDRYYSKVSWTVHFAWHDTERSILAVTLDLKSRGVNLKPEPYQPNGRPWVLASTHGFQTRYLHYSLSCPSHFEQIDLHDDELQPYVVVQGDGSIYLRETDIVAGRSVPTGMAFESVNRTRMYRHSLGYIPLHYSRFIESVTFTLTGPALNDLDLRVSHPVPKARKEPTAWNRPPSDGANFDTHTFGRATPGQVTLVSWGPRNAQADGHA